MKISILTPDLSLNCLVRPYLLAKMLMKRYEVEIVGPLFGQRVWQAVAGDTTLRFKTVDFRGHFRPYPGMVELVKKTDGDIIYASKPMITSYGIGIIKKKFQRKPLILDIEDWDMGFIMDGLCKASLPGRIKALASMVAEPYRLNSLVNTWWMEKYAFYADAITVSNNFLKKRFGGDIICHARDTALFDPEKYDGQRVRREHGIPEDAKVIVFSGTPRPWKGIDDLIEAMGITGDERLFLVVTGMADDEYCRQISKKAENVLGNRFLGTGLVPFEMVPETLSMADIVVIPQKKGMATLGQVPAKIYDAMAMAKPVIATAVSDIPEIIEGCGWVVKPDDPGEQAGAIKYVLDHPDEASEKGNKARQRCVEKYSLRAVEEKLFDIVDKVRNSAGT